MTNSKIHDSFFSFYFKFILPNKSRLEQNLYQKVWVQIQEDFNKYVSFVWESLVRESIPHSEIFHNNWDIARRWWGKGLDGKEMEIDVMAESIDKTSLLIGEVRWSENINTNEIDKEISKKISNLPMNMDRYKKIFKGIWSKGKVKKSNNDIHIFTPVDVISLLK